MLINDRMKTKTIATSLLAALCLSACSSNDDWLTGVKPNNEETAETRHSYTPVQLSETQQAINAKLQEFSWKLFKEVYANRQEGSNLMISPISLGVDLGMFINGLEGETLQEVLKTMGLEGFTKAQINDYFKTMMTGIENADEAATFKSANSFWYNKSKTASKDFLSVIQSNYDAKTEAVDFSDSKTKDLINTWCAEKTENRIKEMVKETSEQDLFHLMNAVYFKAQWQIQFSKEVTTKQPFHYADGTVSEIDMMHNRNNALYAETDDYQMTFKGFVDDAFQFVIILPKEGVGVSKVMSTVSNIEQYKAMMTPEGVAEVDLYMPRFTTEYLEEKLFPYMININPSLKFFVEDMTFIEDAAVELLSAKQKTYIKVDENGAEAAAVTAISGEGAYLPPKKVEMRLDRPFFYAIVERNTMCPLFIGYYGK